MDVVKILTICVSERGRKQSGSLDIPRFSLGNIGLVLSPRTVPPSLMGLFVASRSGLWRRY
jgi:hypothetical protein